MKLSGKILHPIPRLIKKKARKKSHQLESYQVFYVAFLTFSGQVERFFVNNFLTNSVLFIKLSGKILHHFPHLIKKKPRKKSNFSESYKLFRIVKKHRFSGLLKKGYKCHFLSQSDSRKLTNQILINNKQRFTAFGNACFF